MKCTSVHSNSEDCNPSHPCTDIVRGLLFAGATKERTAQYATPDAPLSAPLKRHSVGYASLARHLQQPKLAPGTYKPER